MNQLFVLVMLGPCTMRQKRLGGTVGGEEGG